MKKRNEPTEKRLSKVSSRARNIERVPARVMGDIVASLRSQGKDVLTLKGAPDWSPPGHVLEAAARAVREEVRSAPSNGFPEFRRAIANRLEEEDGITVDPETEVLVTNGGMHALNVVFMTFLDIGDEAIMYSPGFCFDLVIELAGAIPVRVETQQGEDWRWNTGALERAITSRTKIITLCSPSNPTGYVPTQDDLLAIAHIARKHDLFVLSDEAYDNMLFDGSRHIRFLSLPGVKERTITVRSFTKSYSMQPWRIGYILAPPDLMPSLRKVLEITVLNCNHVAQRAAQAALEGPQDWVKEIASRFQRNRDLVVEGLSSAQGISFAVPKAAPFLFLNTGGLKMTGEEFSSMLMRDYGVPAEPGNVYGSRSHVRLMFGGHEDAVREAAKRISKAAKNLAEEG